MEKQIGIYKITSPTDKIYIGQSKNIQKRWSYYKNLNCKGQQKLYKSFLKYGVINHVFEILELCSEQELNTKEFDYIKKYNSFNTKHGLNLTSGGDNLLVSDETRKKISISNTGRKATNESRKKMSESAKGRAMLPQTRDALYNANKGRKMSDVNKQKMSERIISDETRKKISNSCKGRLMSDETKNKISIAHRLENLSEEKRENISRGQKGKKMAKDSIFKTSLANTKYIIDTRTGIVYFGIKECAISLGINQSTLRNKLSGWKKNNTSLIYKK